MKNWGWFPNTGEYPNDGLLTICSCLTIIGLYSFHIKVFTLLGKSLTLHRRRDVVERISQKSDYFEHQNASAVTKTIWVYAHFDEQNNRLLC